MSTKHNGKGIGGHTKPHKGATDEWGTPIHITESLGEFDLDPCAMKSLPWQHAKSLYTIEDDGFNKEWNGRVWLNPPYSQAAKWLKKLAEHKHGTALIFARTDTKMFFDHVWSHAKSILFLKGRLFFHHPDGTRAKHNSGGPSCIIAYSWYDAEQLNASGLEGKYLFL